jgi:hypothetical protein
MAMRRVARVSRPNGPFAPIERDVLDPNSRVPNKQTENH